MRTKQFYHVFLASVMLAATAGLMTSCATEDNPGKPNGPSESVIKENIIGKWKGITQDGSELTTNDRTVLTFNADGTRTVSKSYYDTDTESYILRNKQTGTYTIEGSQLKSYLDEADLYDVVTYNIDAIGSNEMAMTMENFRPGRKFDYNRVTTDYAAEIVGVWEGVEMTGDETYGNAEARIVYEANGKFYYFSKNDEGQWAINFKESDRKYIVDGDWLATSWKDENGNTNFECWDIDEIKGDVMKWSALREREDGTRFKTTFTWRKISNRPALVLTVGDTSIGLVFIKGGDYSMTINRDGTELKTSGTTDDFYIAQTEVTNKLWKAVMGSVPTELEQKGDEYPVALNSYNYLVKEGGFLDKLNEMVKDQLPAGKKLALPTEVEWHYAAMGGQQSKGYKYAGSNTIGDVAWYLDNCNSSTQPVSQKEPNELGIYDMSGNVWEFTSTLADGKVITCGGGWTSEANWCEVNLSFPDDPDTRFNNTGLRLVIK
ncbi:MAG: SUMF1/EgtB/PvdO family nonheme iron enzyme [Prevotella sp.]|nr:SUMF1/EgtB/PvdO family nonheme iron enzyme [Prevotella sp.]